MIRPAMVALCLLGAATTARRGGRVARASFVRRRLRGGAPSSPGRRSPVRWVGRWRSCPTRFVVGPAAVAVAAAAWVGGWPGSVLVSAAAGAVAVARRAHRLGAGPRYEAAMVDLVDAVARRLRAGANLPTAVREAIADAPEPLRDDLEAVQAVFGRGDRLDEALLEWRRARRLPTVGLVTGALAVGAASGGLRAVVVDDLALMLRQRDRARREAHALAGQARASAAVLMVAPLFVVVVLAAGDRSVRDFLLQSPAGLVCLSSGLALDLAAAAWMVHVTLGATWLR